MHIQMKATQNDSNISTPQFECLTEWQVDSNTGQQYSHIATEQYSTITSQFTGNEARQPHTQAMAQRRTHNHRSNTQLTHRQETMRQPTGPTLNSQVQVQIKNKTCPAANSQTHNRWTYHKQTTLHVKEAQIISMWSIIFVIAVRDIVILKKKEASVLQ